MSRYIFIHGSVNGSESYIPYNIPTEIKDFMQDLRGKCFNDRNNRLEKLGVNKSEIISKALLLHLYKGFICYTFFIDNLISNENVESGRPGQYFGITILSSDECLRCEGLYTFIVDLYTKGTKKILNNRTYLINTFKEATKTFDDIIEIINNNINNLNIGMFIKNIPNLNNSHKESTEVINLKDSGNIWDDVFEGREFYLTDTVPTITDKYEKMKQENVKLKTNNTNKSNKEMADIKQQLEKVTAERDGYAKGRTQLENKIEELVNICTECLAKLRQFTDDLGEKLNNVTGVVVKGINETQANPPKNTEKNEKIGVEQLLKILFYIFYVIFMITWFVFFFGGKTNDIEHQNIDKNFREETTQHPQNVSESNYELSQKKEKLKREISDIDYELQERKRRIDELNRCYISPYDEKVGIGSIVE